MTQILPSASYLRSSDRRGAHGDDAVLLALCAQHNLGPPDASRKIWQLLETPQTVETICRVLTSEYHLPRQTCSVEVREFLAQLYQRDLIELSPDT